MSDSGWQVCVGPSVALQHASPLLLLLLGCSRWIYQHRAKSKPGGRAPQLRLTLLLA